MALAFRERLRKTTRLPLCDQTAFELGAALAGKTPIDDLLAQFERRHRIAKDDDAWIRHRGLGRELARDADDKWKLPTVATLHGYRLTAFAQILNGLN